jgi:hypothetical protein
VTNFQIHLPIIRIHRFDAYKALEYQTGMADTSYMSFGRNVACIVVVLATLTAARAANLNRIQIRFYSLIPLTDTELREALTSANSILAQAAVYVNWLDCSESSAVKGGPLPCARPPSANDFILRLAASAPATDKNPLGRSIVDVTRGGGVLATVYVDRVNGAADTLGVNRHTLLGRVAAHEIGHLLLGPDRHTRTGLMRADWSPQSIRGSNLRDWLFSKDESRRMQAGIIARDRQRENALARLNSRSVQPRLTR